MVIKGSKRRRLSLGGFSLGCRKQRRRREVNEEREKEGVFIGVEL